MIETEFEEPLDAQRTVALPLAHLSVELGHLYQEDYEAGPARLAETAARVKPWAALARQVCRQRVAPRTPRVSTCFLIDDYFGTLAAPSRILPMIVDAYAEADVQLDYIVREAGCAEAAGVPIAELVAARLIDDPPPGTDGSRPTVHDSGWLANGVRSPQAGGEAMGLTAGGWQPPVQNAVTRHSVFIDVQLWDEIGGRRRWSCPMLATVWQLIRLGALRHGGRPVVAPEPWSGRWPDEWGQTPAVLQLNPQAAPLAAYETFSVLGGRFLPVEHAVRTILGQVHIEAVVAEQIVDRAGREGVSLPSEVIDRVGYVFA